MEQLTKRENGNAHYPRFFEEPCCGMGCRTEDCEFKVEICERLAAYEDTGLEPEEVLPKDKADEIVLKLMRLADLESLCNYTRLRELAEADKDGRVAVLPCKVGGSMLNAFDIVRPEIMKDLHFAVAYESVRGIIFHLPYDIFRENVDAGHIQPLNKLKEVQNG